MPVKTVHYLGVRTEGTDSANRCLPFHVPHLVLKGDWR